MASIRKTKKDIRYACGDIAAELLIAAHIVKDFDRQQTNKLINDIAALQIDALSKCSFDFDKVPADFEDGKAYRKAKHVYTAAAFRKLKEEMAASMQKIVDEMNAAVKA